MSVALADRPTEIYGEMLNGARNVSAAYDASVSADINRLQSNFDAPSFDAEAIRIENARQALAAQLARDTQEAQDAAAKLGAVVDAPKQFVDTVNMGASAVNMSAGVLKKNVNIPTLPTADLNSTLISTTTKKVQEELAAKQGAVIQSVVTDGAGAVKYAGGSPVLSEVFGKATDATAKAATEKMATQTIDIAANAVMEEAGEKVAQAVAEKAGKETFAETGKVALTVTGNKVKDIGGKVVERTGQIVQYKAIDTVGDLAVQKTAEAVAENAADVSVQAAAKGISKATWITEAAMATVKIGHCAIELDKEKKMLVAMYRNDLEHAAKDGKITLESDIKFDDLRALAASDVGSYKQLQAEIDRIDAELAKSAAKAGVSTAAGVAGTAAGVTAAGLALTATGVGAPVGVVVTCAGLAGSVLMSVAADQATRGFFETENGMKYVQDMGKTLDKGEKITTEDVFKVLMADDPALQEKVNNLIKRAGEGGKTFEQLDPKTKEAAMGACGDIKNACAALADGINTGYIEAKDLLKMNNLALANGGKDVAELFMEVEQQKIVLPDAADNSSVSFNSSEMPSTKVGSDVAFEGTIQNPNRQLGAGYASSVRAAQQSQQQFAEPYRG